MYLVPAIHANDQNSIFLVAKGNNWFQTFLKVKLSHGPLRAEVLWQDACKISAQKYINYVVLYAFLLQR